MKNKFENRYGTKKGRQTLTRKVENLADCPFGTIQFRKEVM